MEKNEVPRQITLPFPFGKKVIIDGDGSLIATVIGYHILDRRMEVQISWVHNGDIKEAYIDRWRIVECSQ